MWYIVIACLAYWLGKRKASSVSNQIHTEAMAVIAKQKITDEKSQHCDMSLYLMQKSMGNNDAYELEEWLEAKGLIVEYNALLAQLEETHQKKYNLSKAQLIVLFEESYLRNYEKFTDQHEVVLNDKL